MATKEDEERFWKAIRLLDKASPDVRNLKRVMKGWKNSFKTGVRTKKDGGSVESYIKRNDGGMAKKTRMF